MKDDTKYCHNCQDAKGHYSVLNSPFQYCSSCIENFAEAARQFRLGIDGEIIKSLETQLESSEKTNKLLEKIIMTILKTHAEITIEKQK